MRAMDEGWQEEATEALVGIKEWRKEHPKATLTEIERAMDERLNRFRKRLLEDVASASQVKEWAGKPEEERPTCRECGTVLVSKGLQDRQLQTQGGELLKLERVYGLCPSCQKGFFPPG